MWRQLALSLAFGVATLLILVAGRPAPQTCPKCRLAGDRHYPQLIADNRNSEIADENLVHRPQGDGNGNGNGNGNIGSNNGNGNMGNGNGNFNQGSNNGNGNVGNYNGNLNQGNGHGNCWIGNGHGNLDRGGQPQLPLRLPCPPFGVAPQHQPPAQPTQMERIFIQAPIGLAKQGG